MKFAIVSPSGGGKTTIVNSILEKFPFFVLSKSYTSRQPRELSENEYIFVSEEEFLQLKSKDFFIETEEIFSNFYGTPKIEYEDIIFNIDIKGLYSLKNVFNDLISIGIVASPHELHKRIIGRGDIQNMKERIERYPFEIEKMKALDFLVINENLEEAIKIVEQIFKIYLHKMKALRLIDTF